MPSWHLPVEKNDRSHRVSRLPSQDSQGSLEFCDWTTKSPCTGAKETRERSRGIFPKKSKAQAWRIVVARRLSIIRPFARFLFIPLFIPLALPFLSVFSSAYRAAVDTFLRVRKAVACLERMSGILVGCHEHKPSLGVPRGQTSSQKLRYVGRSTAAHPGHPLTRETHASLLNQRRNRPPT